MRGITLIETIVYLAIFSLLLTGIIVTTYPLFTGAERISKNITAEGEAAFVLRKIAWALGSATSASVPSINTLAVQHTTAGALTFDLNETTFALELNSTPLNAARAPISNFTVTNTPTAGGIPRYIEIQFDSGAAHIGPIRHYVHY